MRLFRFVVMACAAGTTLGAGRSAIAQSSETIELVVPQGTPLRVALDETIRIKEVGQPINGMLVEPVYAYDRVVLLAGTEVRGHVTRFQEAGRSVRLRTMLGGDFSPVRQVVLEFDTVERSGHRWRRPDRSLPR